MANLRAPDEDKALTSPGRKEEIKRNKVACSCLTEKEHCRALLCLCQTGGFWELGAICDAGTSSLVIGLVNNEGMKNSKVGKILSTACNRNR